MAVNYLGVERVGFIKGMARTLDLGSTFDTRYKCVLPRRVDFMSMRHDWLMVGQDMRVAINEYRSKHHGKSK